MKGAYGESDLNTGLIRINKKKHKQAYKRINPLPNGDEEITSTLTHELLHFKYPNKGEQKIRRLEKKTVAEMTSTEKRKLLAKLK